MCRVYRIKSIVQHIMISFSAVVGQVVHRLPKMFCRPMKTVPLRDYAGSWTVLRCISLNNYNRIFRHQTDLNIIDV